MPIEKCTDRELLDRQPNDKAVFHRHIGLGIPATKTRYQMKPKHEPYLS